MADSKLFFEFLETYAIEFVDFRFTDILGLWHHMTFAKDAVNEDLLREGIYFDGSSLSAWRAVHESDMILRPDISRFMQDPFSAQPTAVVFCDIYDPLTNLPYDRDPRSIGRQAEAYLAKTGFADNAFFGPEAEFFVFDGVRFSSHRHHSFYEIASDEFPESNSRSLTEGNLGHRPQPKGGYIPTMPIDGLSDLRSEMVTTMTAMGLVLEKHHHEVAPGQHEIGFKFGQLVETADNLQIYKYVVKNVAQSYGKTATFMPKPIFGDNGSGMHVHQSLWKGTEPLFAGEEYAGLSEIALYYIGGILKHAKALNAFTNPTTNSYKRLIPGYEAPVILAYSAQNRSASCRIPTSSGRKSKRVEVRFPDPMANSYLAFAAMMMAGVDGILNKIHPGHPHDINLYEESHIAKTLPIVSTSLQESLKALEEDHDFLTAGNVFSKGFIKSYIELKMQEVDHYNQSPHPWEFQRYYTL